MHNNLLERLQALSEALEEAVDHIETLEAILRHIEASNPKVVENARAVVAVTRKGQHI